MRLMSLTYLVAALFLLAACETVTTDEGGGQGTGDLKAKRHGGKLVTKPRAPAAIPFVLQKIDTATPLPGLTTWNALGGTT